MHSTDDGPLTPIYLKTQRDMSWPEDKVFYLLTADGLFLCRNHEFFRSSVSSPRWPSELAWHDPMLVPRYPKLASRQIEEVVGFFSHVGQLYGSEAIVLLAWDSLSKELQIVVPEQLATVGQNRWGDTWPIGVEYDMPANLPSHVTILGDIHSHVDGAAYASHTDRDDETHRPGLHIVVGRLNREPPEFHIQAVVDGTRFNMSPERVMDGYSRRNPEYPAWWLDNFRIKGIGANPGASTSSNR